MIIILKPYNPISVDRLLKKVNVSFLMQNKKDIKQTQTSINKQNKIIPSLLIASG